MPSNGSSRHAAAPAVEQASANMFSKLSRYLGRVSKNPDIQSVHHLRTNSRRVEALVEEFAPDTGSKRKLLKQLSKLRKKAGRVRDLDVQLAFLSALKMPDRQNHRAQLMERLREEQERRGKRLSKSFASDRVEKIRKRLNRTRKDMQFDGVDPLQLALKRVPRPNTSNINEPALHACRIAAKQARYLAELAEDSAEAKALIDHLKRAQDEIGQWHDVLKLQQRAEELFGGVRDSALVSLLQNITRARFRRATSGLLAALTAIQAMRQESSVPATVMPEHSAAEAAAA